MSPRDEHAAARLVEWLERRGGRIGPLRVAAADAGRGVFAAAPIDAAAPLLVVPRDCQITPAVAAQAPAAAFVAATWTGLARDHALLAAFVVHARRAADATWRPYLDTLPDALPGHPLFFSAAELAPVRGTGFAALLALRRARLVDEWQHLRRASVGLDDLECDEWLLARSLVTSRAFALGPEAEPTLVPIADLLNHSLTPETGWDRAADGAFELRAEIAIAAGLEVHDSYGQKSNARLLLHYGFVLDGNPIADCPIDLDDAGMHTLSCDPEDPAILALLARLDADRARAIRRLAAICRARLERLAPPDDRSITTTNALRASAVRESERRILRWWAERGG